MRSVEIELARLFAEFRIGLRLLEEFVELPVEDLPLVFFRREGLLKSLFAPTGFAFELSDSRCKVFNRSGPHRLFVGDDSAQRGIHLQRRLATRACNLKEFAGHAPIIQPTYV